MSTTRRRVARAKRGAGPLPTIAGRAGRGGVNERSQPSAAANRAVRSTRAKKRGVLATDAVVAFTTAGSRDEAERVAHALVAERLAACVNLVAPITSIYQWRGAVERGEEVLLIIKTRRVLVRDLGSRLRELHSYEVPELIVLPIVDGAKSYLGWLLDETRGGKPKR